jgi:hypothetical protein
MKITDTARKDEQCHGINGLVLTPWQIEKTQKIFGNPTALYEHFSRGKIDDVDQALYRILPVWATQHQFDMDNSPNLRYHKAAWTLNRDAMKDLGHETLREVSKYSISIQRAALDNGNITLAEYAVNVGNLQRIFHVAEKQIELCYLLGGVKAQQRAHEKRRAHFVLTGAPLLM